jgi:hypothetical protein
MNAVHADGQGRAFGRPPALACICNELDVAWVPSQDLLEILGRHRPSGALAPFLLGATDPSGHIRDHSLGSVSTIYAMRARRFDSNKARNWRPCRASSVMRASPRRPIPTVTSLLRCSIGQPSEPTSSSAGRALRGTERGTGRTRRTPGPTSGGRFVRELVARPEGFEPPTY